MNKRYKINKLQFIWEMPKLLPVLSTINASTKQPEL